MLDRMGFWCCVLGAVSAVASFIWPGKHLLAWGIGLFVLGLLLQRIGRRDADVAEALGEAAADVLDLGD